MDIKILIRYRVSEFNSGEAVFNLGVEPWKDIDPVKSTPKLKTAFRTVKPYQQYLKFIELLERQKIEFTEEALQ